MRVVIQVIQVSQKRRASLIPTQQRVVRVEPQEPTIPGVSQAGVDPVEVEPREQMIPEVTQAEVKPPEQTIPEATQAEVEQLLLEVENWNTVFQSLFQNQILIQDVQVLEGF